MHVLTWAGHHRLLALGAGISCLMALMALGLWFLVVRSPTTQVDLSQALRLYRQGQRPGIATGDPRLPRSGVYRYRTTGSERLNLGGIRRYFPTTTQMIVTDGRCTTMEWEPFEQHTEGLVACPSTGGAVVFASAPTFEEIAGVRSTTDIRCSSGAYLLPPDPTVGVRWRSTCVADGTKVDYTGQLIGTSSVDVGHVRVPALHVRIGLELSGAESGSNPSDYWLSARNGMILRQDETVDLHQQAGPLGSVSYSESMTISLESLSPQR